MKDEGGTITSLCRVISKPRGRICRNQLGKRFSLRESQGLGFWGPARKAVGDASLILLHNSLKPRRGMFNCRDDNMNPVVPPWTMRLRKEAPITSDFPKLLAPAPWGLCLSSVHSNRQVDTGSEIRLPGLRSQLCHLLVV